MLRAYLCTKPECAHMAYTLGSFAAQKGQAVLVLPARWIEDPESAAEGYRRQAREDAAQIEAAGVKAFPVMIEGERVITEGDWLEYSGGVC